MSDLLDLYDRLFARYGPQHWWPAESDVEMVVGAFLVQNTAWANAEKAVSALKAADRLRVEALDALTRDELAELIRSSGFHRQKAARIKGFVAHLAQRHGGSLERLLARPTADLRAELLSLDGVGPETADSIVLYAARQPSFVVDAYTRRLFYRLGWSERPTYETIQARCHQELPRDSALFNEFHALIVRHAVVHCRARPRCAGCPLLDRCARRN